jgi:beta-ureidopropionase / N-carbamoyl-L-amino-acid hydrolase
MELTRRAFLQATAAVPASAFVPRTRATTMPRVDGGRLRAQLEALSVFGRPAGGRFEDGVSRVAFSDADIAGRRYVTDIMREVGLTPRIDAAGNMFARREGSDASLPPILFGSHIDSVPSGGNFDGDLGTLAAIEAVRVLAAARVTTRHPLEVVLWANEEGVAFGKPLFGSRVVAGRLAPREIDERWEGVILSDAVRRIGGAPDRLAEAQRQAGSFHCYFELHIEQGGTLHRAGIPIGIVEGIVGIERLEAEIRGFANHAGTTPMGERQDALLAASRLTIAVNEVVTREAGRQVGTVGRIEVAPNAPNVIPGAVRQTMEVRDLSMSKVQRLVDAIKREAGLIAEATRTQIELRPLSHAEPAMADPRVQSVIGAAAEGLALPHRALPSGAGHDAQSMAALGPMGMIFVPSVGGISHSPRELTSWEDCARGADVLIHAVLRADEARFTS